VYSLPSRLCWVGFVYSSTTVGQLWRAAQISRNSASKWHKVLIAEAAVPAQSEAQEWAI
jgi:hypothetical protein